MKKPWHDRLKRILAWPALTSSVTAAAFGSGDQAVRASVIAGEEQQPPPVLPNTLNATAQDRYAAHQSHASHGSHGSHRSSAGGSGGYVPSAPVPPTPRTVPKPTPPPVATPPAAQNFSLMVVRVQAALMRKGYYIGDIDGLLGPATRSAITAYQIDHDIPATGRMDIKTLSKLGISIP